jgi:hypothetical protein
MEPKKKEAMLRWENNCDSVRVFTTVTWWVYVNKPPQKTEVEFLEEIQTEVLRVFLLAIHRHLYKEILLPSFNFLGLEISTALPCDFYSNSRGGGDVWVNKYLDHWRVSNYQANRLLKSSHEIWTQIVRFDFQYFHHWTIEDIYVSSKITCVKTIPHST